MKKILWEKRVELFRRIANQVYKKSLGKLISGICTYDSGVTIINNFEDVGLIITNNSGREKHAELTEKGKQVFIQLNRLKDIEIW